MKIYAEAGGEARVGSDVVAGPAEAMVATAAVPVQAPTITSIKKRTEEDKLGIIAAEAKKLNLQIYERPIIPLVQSLSQSDAANYFSMFHFKHAQNSFQFPVHALISVKRIQRCCQESEFNDVKYVCAGSNSFVYSAWRNKELVIVKMLKNKLANPQIAEHEMDLESRILTKFNHPNIIDIKAAGRNPRPFIVVEYLEGGTLASLLEKTNKRGGNLASLAGWGNTPSSSSSPSSSSKSPAIGLPLKLVIKIARQLVSAMKYLHDDVSPHATIIHRDLKPMNIGFTADKTLKLFDFGLAASIRKRAPCDEVFQMTGYTGTRAYMAPEVAKKEPYNHKVDIYSFGIILWQMLTGQSPFKGMSREEHMEKVIHGGLRPSLLVGGDGEDANLRHPNITESLAALLERCWDEDYRVRPNCREILAALDKEALQFTALATVRRATRALVSLVPKMLSFDRTNKYRKSSKVAVTPSEEVVVVGEVVQTGGEEARGDKGQDSNGGGEAPAALPAVEEGEEAVVDENPPSLRLITSSLHGRERRQTASSDLGLTALPSPSLSDP